jgi:uncharacterized protein (TIGR00251 family)
MMTIIKIRVKPDSPRFRVSDRGDHLLVEVTSPARDNKANQELLKGLKRHFGKDIVILKGFRSRDKMIAV